MYFTKTVGILFSESSNQIEILYSTGFLHFLFIVATTNYIHVYHITMIRVRGKVKIC